MKLPKGPIIVRQLPALLSGVDFLGLGAVNERLIAEFLPGINNVTRYMRVYSTMCWMAWRFDRWFEEEARRLSRSEIDRRFRAYREKVELLFTWGNKRHGFGIVGSRRPFPTTNATQRLRFEEFGTSVVSWLDAALYGPSLKVANGLGFLDTAPGHAFRPTDAGSALAEALDASLRSSSYYDRLCDVTDETGTLRMAMDLGERWSLHESRNHERQVFAAYFAPPDATADNDALGAERVIVVSLVRQAIRVNGGSASIDAVRQTLARGIDRRGGPLAIGREEQSRARWAALQVRQLQRLCHEAMLRWVERVLFDPPADLQGRSIAHIARYCGIRALAGLELPQNAALVQVTDLIRRRLKAGETPLLAGRKDPEVDPFHQMSVLLELQRDGNEIAKVPALALRGLAVVAVQVEHMIDDELYSRAWLMGGQRRVSVSTLIEMFETHSTAPATEFVEMLIESLTIGQHFATANARLELGKNKYRFVPSDDGLQPLITPKQVLRLGVTNDRLEIGMNLMADCGLLERDRQTDTFSLPV